LLPFVKGSYESIAALRDRQQSAKKPFGGGGNPNLALPAAGSRSLELEHNLNRGLSLPSEQSYLRGDDNLAPRQICRDGHYQMQLVMAPV
jgi:hypothetical protein